MKRISAGDWVKLKNIEYSFGNEVKGMWVKVLQVTCIFSDINGKKPKVAMILISIPYPVGKYQAHTSWWIFPSQVVSCKKRLKNENPV